MDKAGRQPMWNLLRKLGFYAVAVAVVGSVAAGTAANAKGPVSETGLGTVALVTLPAEARQTQRLIHAGGPFPHAKDGVVFGNFERVLPRHERGFYREYTVPTPGLQHRGARRIVCGGQRTTEPDACYYTADHYASFKRIAP